MYKLNLTLTQSLLVFFTISLIACTSEKDNTESHQPIAETKSVDHNPFLPSTEQKYQAPKGVNCESVFKKNATELMAQSKQGIYLGEEAFTYINNAKEIGMILIPLYRSGNFGFMVKLLHNNKVVCLAKDAPFGFRFLGDNKTAYGLDGTHKPNCMKGNYTPEDFAMGLYDFPINSIAFKKALEKDLEFVAIQADIGFLPAAPTDGANSTTAFKNMMRCVYEAVGSGVDLSNDNLLINNRFSKSN